MRAAALLSGRRIEKSAHALSGPAIFADDLPYVFRSNSQLDDHTAVFLDLVNLNRVGIVHQRLSDCGNQIFQGHFQLSAAVASSGWAFCAFLISRSTVSEA